MRGALHGGRGGSTGLAEVVQPHIRLASDRLPSRILYIAETGFLSNEACCFGSCKILQLFLYGWIWRFWWVWIPVLLLPC
jgi:hypothetical protein